MRFRQTAPGSVLVLALIVLSVSVLAPTSPTQAQAEIPLTVSLPTQWQDILTPDILAEFESLHPGVKVYTVLAGNSFGFFNVTGTSVDDRLQDTADLVTSADVVYVTANTLNQEGTQAGYFLDLSPLVMSDAAFNVNDFVPGVWQSFQWDNAVWALPVSTDVILVTYDPDALDAAGVGYPNPQWTLDDFAYAARQLTQYDSDGSVSTPGLMVNAASNSQELFLRSLLSAGLYDSTTLPNAPLFSSPELEPLVNTWYELVTDGVLSSRGFGETDVPLRVEGVNGYSSFRFGNDAEETIRYASLLPGGVAGLSAQGFAVSAGSQYPELAYALADFLTTRSELSTFSASPARYSLMGVTTTSNDTGPGGQGGGPGGAPGGGGFGNNIPDDIQPVVEQGLNAGLPTSEIRYIPFLSAAIEEMQTASVDAFTALQDVEVQAASDMQAAVAIRGTEDLIVAAPEVEAPLAAGEIALNCAVNQGMGGGGFGGGQLFNQSDWDQVIADFVASDPLVGTVHLESTNESDLATLAEQYDCFILPNNAVPDGDVSVLLSLDPLLDPDSTFDRNDVIGNVLSQVQQDNLIWALPMAVQVQMLQYDPQMLAWAGVPEPVDGWTIDVFVDALHMLKTYDPESTPFVANDPSGSYVLMLIGVFGGLPLDYRTDPPAINFTDPATVDAIQQVLDLVADGYIAYNNEGGPMANTSDEPVAITTAFANRFNFRGAGPGGQSASQQTYSQQTYVQAMFPQGSTYGVIAVEITAGYISATAQNPDSAYNFLSLVSRSPQLFSGMPARQSLIYTPEVAASQGENVVALYQQIDTLLRAPNTITFPSFQAGRGASSFVQQNWLNQAFNSYLNEGADLETELADAQQLSSDYQACIANIVVDESAEDSNRQYFEQMFQCITTVDPSFGQ